MKIECFIRILIYLQFLSFPFLKAQEVILSSGNTYSGSGGSISCSSGQVFYTTGLGNGSLEQGIQHPYETFTSTDLTQFYGEMDCSVYPNPVNYVLQLKINGDQEFQFSYELYETNGSLLESGEIYLNEKSIDMSHYSGGTYLLRIVDVEDRVVRIFKIVKD